jgi:hypothetical protein
MTRRGNQYVFTPYELEAVIEEHIRRQYRDRFHVEHIRLDVDAYEVVVSGESKGDL